MYTGLMDWLKWFKTASKKNVESGPDPKRLPLGILRVGRAERVHFYYPGEDGTFIENADVTLYESGVIHIQAKHEETTTHLVHCEIIWNVFPSNEVVGGSTAGNVLNFPRKLIPKSDLEPYPEN